MTFMGKNIHYGAGLCGPEEWENYDSSPMLLLQRTPLLRLLPLARRGARYPETVRSGNVLKGLPVKDGEADHVYCSHVLEHLALSELRQALRETYRMLRPGGVFRGVLPDLRTLCEDYVRKSPHDHDAAIVFMQDSGLGQADSPHGLAWVRHKFFARDFHLWLWDYPALEKELQDAGFSRVRPAKFHDSEHKVFLSVEDAGRWDRALGFEAIK